MIDSDVESMVQNIKSLAKEIDDLRSSKAPNIVQFQGVIFKDLQEVLNWLEKNIPTLNYSLIIDLHSLFEHVAH